jgi:hypothetical protein
MPKLLKWDRQSYPLTLRANVLLPGLYAWLTTVAYPTTYRGASSVARITAFMALLALLSGPILALDRPRLGRVFGLYAFVGSSLVTWIALGPLVSVDRLEPVRSALGAVGWAVFALGWGAVRRVDSVPEEDPHVIVGPPLVARSRLAPGAVIILGAGICGSLVPLMLAWRVTRSDHALLAHAVALLCALGIITTASKVALGRGQPRPLPSARQRFNSALRPLAVLAVVLGLGFVWLLLR